MLGTYIERDARGRKHFRCAAHASRYAEFDPDLVLPHCEICLAQKCERAPSQRARKLAAELRRRKRSEARRKWKQLAKERGTWNKGNVKEQRRRWKRRQKVGV